MSSMDETAFEGIDFLETLPDIDDNNMIYGSSSGTISIKNTNFGMEEEVKPHPEYISARILEENEINDDIGIEELEQHILMDEMRLKYMKEQMQNQTTEQCEPAELLQSQALARRKKASRVQNGILKCMNKLMDECNCDGFAYGIILENGKPVSAVSDSLREWWKEEVKFNNNGPRAISKFQLHNLIPEIILVTNSNMSNPKMLHALSGTTLESLLSILTKNCDPPIKKFPLVKGSPPSWWPTANEDWWIQLGIPKDVGPPPYKKPHDLRKIWKISVLVAVVKHMISHMSLEIEQIQGLMRNSKCLGDRMTIEEESVFISFLSQEKKLYLQLQPDAPCNHPSVSFSGGRLYSNHNSEYNDKDYTDNIDVINHEWVEGSSSQDCANAGMENILVNTPIEENYHQANVPSLKYLNQRSPIILDQQINSPQGSILEENCLGVESGTRDKVIKDTGSEMPHCAFPGETYSQTIFKEQTTI